MKLFITTKRNLKALRYSIEITILMVAVHLFCIFKLDMNANITLLGTISFLAIVIIPALYLHVEYYILSRGKFIEIENDKIVIQK